MAGRALAAAVAALGVVRCASAGAGA
eukprot:COSAG04_NODE_1695_length_5903_cov_8.707099_1_plen_25_part_10